MAAASENFWLLFATRFIVGVFGVNILGATKKYRKTLINLFWHFARSTDVTNFYVKVWNLYFTCFSPVSGEIVFWLGFAFRMLKMWTNDFSYIFIIVTDRGPTVETIECLQ